MPCGPYNVRYAVIIAGISVRFAEMITRISLDQDSHLLERQSRYVTIAGRGIARDPPIWRSRQARRCRPWWVPIWVIQTPPMHTAHNCRTTRGTIALAAIGVMPCMPCVPGTDQFPSLDSLPTTRRL